MQYEDQTFKGLYHWNLFDAAVLLPYFAVMILLSLYGIHRYTMAYQYFKYRKNYNPNPPQQFDELPSVTIQLPIFNEQFVIDRLVEAICAIDYPKEKLEIQVLDDSTDETVEVAAAIVARYAAMGHPIVYIHRTNRHGYKAGALDAGLKVAKGKFIAIFDADFVPPTELADEGDPPFCRTRDWHGADALDAPESRLQHSYADRGDPARRALCSGAWGARAVGGVLQLQRHGGNVAARGNQ